MAVLAPVAVFADGADAAKTEGATISGKAIGSGIAIGLAAAGGAIAMGLASGKANEGIARQPEANGQIRSTLMLSLVFIETAIIYALLVVILVIFVL
ncbi:MAG: F0F1 ATP synthase subunit C [Oscillospiraceae bacterium]|nr:F0F1 ATP synthase subunit C [Oscillospiraceae bacterium]